MVLILTRVIRICGAIARSLCYVGGSYYVGGSGVTESKIDPIFSGLHPPFFLLAVPLFRDENGYSTNFNSDPTLMSDKMKKKTVQIF